MILDIIKIVLIVLLVVICVSAFAAFVGFIADLISVFTGVMVFIPGDILFGLKLLLTCSLGLIVYNWIKGW